MGYIPEKRTSWLEKPEHLEQILEIFGMIPWKKLDDPSMVGSFIS